MIIGIGNDMIEMERVRKACEKDAFLTRCFTSEELRTLEGKPEKLAGNFCVKEAVAKAFGTGFRSFLPDEIQVLRDCLGKPYVELLGRAKELACELGVDAIHVSISNLKELASAVVVLERKDIQDLADCGPKQHKDGGNG